MRKAGITSIVFSILLFVAFACDMSTAFEPVYSKAEIKQKIGGVLICNTVYNADQHSWQYDVNYKYKDENDCIFEIGNGTYYGREWNKNEQLIKFDKWILLPTGGSFGSDKIIIGNCKNTNWINYEFKPETIESEKLWKSSNIHSLLDYCCPEAFIKKIDNGRIEVLYKFRTSERITKLMGMRKLIYEIDTATGQLKMTGIEKVNN